MRKLVLRCLSVVAAIAVLSVTAVRADPLGPAFTYQGFLKLSGTPVDPEADFQFSLWNAPDCLPPGGTQLGVTQTLLSVPVTHGLFTVVLNGLGEFGPSAFDGNARWLQIAVRFPPGSGSYTTLCPRQELTAAPYALFARNAGLLDGLDSTAFLTSVPIPLTLSGAQPGGHIIKGSNSAGTTSSTGVFGETTAAPGQTYGILGRQRSGSGLVPSGGGGVVGDSDSSKGVAGLTATGIGVLGLAASGSAASFAGNFQNLSANGTGVKGWHTASTGLTPGVYGLTSSTDFAPTWIEGAAGVLGEVAPGGMNHSAGVRGVNFSTSGSGAGVVGVGSGKGVYGESTGYGVYGLSSATAGPMAGVYGQTSSPDDAGVHGVDTASGAGFGVWGETNSGDVEASGVYGLAGNSAGFATGVRGVSAGLNGTGVKGEATRITGTNWGVFGTSASSGGGSTGVHGEATAAAGITYGVDGRTYSLTNGTAWNDGAAGVLGSVTSATAGTYSAGVRGINERTTGSVAAGVVGIGKGNNSGVYGTSVDGAGVSGKATAVTGINYGIYGDSDSPDGWGVYASGTTDTAKKGGGLRCFGHFDMSMGRFKATPTTTDWPTNKPATVKLNDGTQVKLFAEEAAEVYFADYGTGRLVTGRARIDLEPAFVQTVTINDQYPMLVFVQLEGDCNGVYVTNKTAAGFDVIELRGGQSTARFSYRVVCHRKYYEGERLASEAEDVAYNTRMLQTVWPELLRQDEAERAARTAASQETTSR